MGSRSWNKAVHVALVAAVVVAVVGGSALSSSLWGGKPERIELPERMDVTPGTTVAELGTRYGIPEPVLLDAFGLSSRAELSREVASLGLDPAAVAGALAARWSLAQEEASKDWRKIRIKFAAWGAFLAGAFILVRKRRVTPRLRVGLYGAAVVIFGVILGSDPSPMGTVKDAVVLYGRSGAIFAPRLVALGVFLLLAVVANKFICSWGCQFGVLQDLLFRLNRDPRDTRHLFLPQVRPCFALSNGVRVAFFAALVGVALLWATDIIEPIDPFRIFKPASLTLGGAVFLAVVLAVSLVTYRPWCHFFCPFGLVGWVAEKAAVFRVRVDRDACIDCKRCAKACPSSVMSAILERDRRVVPDCFSCGTCLDVCPTGAVHFEAGRRRAPR